MEFSENLITNKINKSLTINDTDLSSHYLENNDYEFTKKIPKINLFDVVVVYYSNENRKIIPLYIFMEYPVIIDDNITIAVCPYTLSCAVFEGKYYPTKYLYNSCLVLRNRILGLCQDGTLGLCQDGTKIISKTDRLLPIYYHTYLDTEKIIIRHEIEIKTFKNSMSQNIDALYFKTKKKINKEYKINDSLLRVIQYKSSKSNDYKYSIIICKDNSGSEYEDLDTTQKQNSCCPCGFDMDGLDIRIILKI